MGKQFWEYRLPDGSVQQDADNPGQPYLHVLDEEDNAADLARISDPYLGQTEFTEETGWPNGKPTTKEFADRNGSWQRVEEPAAVPAVPDAPLAGAPEDVHAQAQADRDSEGPQTGKLTEPVTTDPAAATAATVLP